MKIGDVDCYLQEVEIRLTDPVWPDGRFSEVKLGFFIESKDVDKFESWLKDNVPNFDLKESYEPPLLTPTPNPLK